MADPYIQVTDSAGVAQRFLLRAGTGISRAPISGQTQVDTVGASDRRADTRTPEVIFTDQSGGMGLFEYEELNGVTAFTDSNCDTRYPGLVCLPPAVTTLSGGTTMTTVAPCAVEYIGAATCRVFLWSRQQTPGYYDPTVPGWTALTTIDTITGFARYNGLYVVTRSAAAVTNGVATSTDAKTWTLRARNKQLTGCCTHDNKFYAYNTTDSTLDWNTDPTSVTYTSSSVLKLLPGEVMAQVFEWQRQGRALVFLLTSARLLWYDEDADAFLTYDDSWAAVLGNAYPAPSATVYQATGDLYLTFGNTANDNMSGTVIHYSGQRELQGPNQRGGLLTASQVTLFRMAGGLHWLFAFAGHPVNNTTSFGRTMVLTASGGWHTLLTGPSNAGYISGGGYGGGLLFSTTASNLIYQQPLLDRPDLPLYAPGTYPTSGTYQHEYAFTDGGTPNMTKAALWVTVQARDHTSTYKQQGTPASTTITVEYLRDSDTTWTSLGALGHASTFPAVLAFGSGFGVAFKEIKLRLTLASTNASNTPIVTSVALAYLRTEQPRDAYSCTIDLSDTTHEYYQGKDRYQLLALLEGYRAPGAIVMLRFGGADWATQPASARTVSACRFSFGGAELADSGPGLYQCTFADMTAPASG